MQPLPPPLPHSASNHAVLPVTVRSELEWEWCKTHHYRDDTVTNSRAARYFQEIFGEPDPLKPEITPLRRQEARKDALGDYLMPETMDFFIKAVIDLWNESTRKATKLQELGGMEEYSKQGFQRTMKSYWTRNC
ncbi:hypothetical protein BGX24_001620, partial [Mortierella sp. AD032]